MEPDLGGYLDAQARLRAGLGRDVPFFIPTPTEWPTDVPTDSAGVPIDPSVAPLASGVIVREVRCSVASRPARGTLQPPADDSPIGLRDHAHLLLAMSYEKYVACGIEEATEAELFDRRYKIEARQLDQVGPGEPQRALIFLEKM